MFLNESAFACLVHNENNQLMNAVQNSTKNTLASTKNSLQLQMFWVAVQRLCSSIYCICIQAPAWFLARIFQILLQTQRSKVQCNCKVWYKLFGAYSMEIYSFWVFPGSVANYKLLRVIYKSMESMETIFHSVPKGYPQ